MPVMEDSRETERSSDLSQTDRDCTPELGLTAASVVEQPQASKTGNENNIAGIGKKTLPESSENKNSRQKWEKGVNRIVIECWLRSEPSKRGYRQRLKRLWDELCVFEATEQRLACQARAIRLNEWLTSLEIEEIKQKIENNPAMRKV